MEHTVGLKMHIYDDAQIEWLAYIPDNKELKYIIGVADTPYEAIKILEEVLKMYYDMRREDGKMPTDSFKKSVSNLNEEGVENLEKAMNKHQTIKIKQRSQMTAEELLQEMEGNLDKIEAYAKKIKEVLKYNYVEGYHSDFENLPKKVRKFIKDQGIDNPETKMFDIDVYHTISIRNYWEKGDKNKNDN